MMAFLRLLVGGFIILTVIYVALSRYSRAVRRSKLERWWAEAGRPGDRDAYVERGLKEYDGSLRRKLIFGVYIVPLCAVLLLIYLENFQ